MCLILTVVAAKVRTGSAAAGRAHPRRVFLHGDSVTMNAYTTTLHAINSAIIKLSKLTVAKPVYRGVSGGRLPKSCLEPNQFGITGGVESGFTSTTIDRSIASPSSP